VLFMDFGKFRQREKTVGRRVGTRPLEGRGWRPPAEHLTKKKTKGGLSEKQASRFRAGALRSVGQKKTERKITPKKKKDSGEKEKCENLKPWGRCNDKAKTTARVSNVPCTSNTEERPGQETYIVGQVALVAASLQRKRNARGRNGDHPPRAKNCHRIKKVG